MFQTMIIIFIKDLANKFEEKIEYLLENTKKYKTFSIPLEKEVIKIEGFITISYRINFIDSVTFIAATSQK